MLKNQKYKDLAQQYINKYNLNLQNYNVLVPMLKQEPYLLAQIAGMAGANNIYLFNPDTNINKAAEFEYKVKITGSISEEILSCSNIILKNSQLPLKNEKMGFFVKKDAAISLFADNLDFLNPQDIDIENCNQKNISVLGLNPADPKIGLYQQLSHIIIKRCYKQGIDIFRSKILLAGNGDFLTCALGVLKSTGAVVYAYNTNSSSDQSYVLKHLKDLDAVIVMDYPQTEKQIIGSAGVISICDLVDLCPLVKILHICGKIETGSLKHGNIEHFPENLVQDSINVNIEELGERGVTELATANFKIAEDFLRNDKKYLQTDNSVVTYKLLTKTPSIFINQ